MGLPVRLLPAWPTVALVGSYELLMMIIHGAQVPVTVVAGLYGSLPGADPVRVQAALMFADDLAAGRVPSVRAIRTRLHVGRRVRSGHRRTWPASLPDSRPDAAPTSIREWVSRERQDGSSRHV